MVPVCSVKLAKNKNYEFDLTHTPPNSAAIHFNIVGMPEVVRAVVKMLLKSELKREYSDPSRMTLSVAFGKSWACHRSNACVLH